MSEETELAWAAGFFDGEGHTRWNSAGGMVIQVPQVGHEGIPEVLLRFQRIAGTGKIYGPYKNDSNHDKYTYMDSGTRVLEKLWPYLGTIKKIQALKAQSNYKRENKKILIWDVALGQMNRL